MCPTLPENSFEKRRLPLLIITPLLLTAAAVFYFFYRKHKLVNGIDTPIVITGGSLELFSDTPFNTYEVAADKKQISHPKEGNTVVRLKVQVKSFTATISLYDKKVDGRCNVEAFYTGDAGEDTVRVFTNSMGKKLKIKFKRKRFDEYDVLGEKTRVHPDGDNKLTRIEITNGSEVTNLTDLSDRCKIIFTYED